MQLKRVLTLLLTVVFVFSLAAPASAVEAVYSVSPDTSVLSAPIYYTEGYYPGVVAEMRSSGLFANNRIAHGSFATMNYNPSIFYRVGSVHSSLENFTIPFNSLTPYVTADQMDISGVFSIPRTTLLQGNTLIAYLPSTSDAYFDFQSSNIAFDQQDANANTFYINGPLTFNLRNLWNFSGSYETTSFYLASDPLAVQLLIDGKAYGDIIDVTGYTSPFTALYNGGVPANASVTFNNLKVYYQGDTPDMIGFRVYTGSAFTDGQYNYNSSGEFISVDVTNTVTMRFSDLPDITFVNEGGDGYAGDLSGISDLLTSVSEKLSQIFTTQVIPGLQYFFTEYGTVSYSPEPTSISDLIRHGFLGLRVLMVDSSGTSWLDKLYSSLSYYLNLQNHVYLTWEGFNSVAGEPLSISSLVANGFVGLATLSRNAQSYVANTVFPWQSFNMQTHQLNASTSITGQNNLFLTAFQSMEDKLGRLAYVFGSDEDLALKDSADPGTDAFRENFGGGLSLGQIKDGADVVEGVSGLFDSGYDFGDAFSEISGDSMFTMWFSSQNAAALDSTSSVMVLDDDDPYNMQIYYDRIYEVTAKRDREEGDTND